MEFRNLTKDEIEVKVSRIVDLCGGGRGARLLIYKNSRVDQQLLDETVGNFNWRNEFRYDGEHCICRIAIRDENGEWVYREDTGEAEGRICGSKAHCSDAFKRAGFRWGIGTELFSAPNILVPGTSCHIVKRTNPRTHESYDWCFDDFTVGAIEYDDKDRISRLDILCNGDLCYRYDAASGPIPAHTGEKDPAGAGTAAKTRKAPGPVSEQTSSPAPEEEEDKLFTSLPDDAGIDRAPAPTAGTSGSRRKKSGSPLPYICDECGETLTDYMGKNNKMVTAERHAALTIKRFGRVLCRDCAVEEKEKREAEAAEASEEEP